MFLGWCQKCFENVRVERSHSRLKKSLCKKINRETTEESNLKLIYRFNELSFKQIVTISTYNVNSFEEASVSNSGTRGNSILGNYEEIIVNFLIFTRLLIGIL